jgi:hypothetical protein
LVTGNEAFYVKYGETMKVSSEILVPLTEEVNLEGYKMIKGDWGYACLVDGKIWIFICASAGELCRHVHGAIRI